LAVENRNSRKRILRKIKRRYVKALEIYSNWRIEMPKNIYVVLFVLVMVAVVVGVDLLFFRNRIWERLMANIGIVLVFVAFYLRFLKNP
jgi:uncharacterized membrane protein